MTTEEFKALSWALEALRPCYVASRLALKHGKLIATATENVKQYETLDKWQHGEDLSRMRENSASQ